MGKNSYMDKGKYLDSQLNSFLLFCSCVIFISYPNYALATAWLPQEDHWQINISYSVTDHASLTNIKERQKALELLRIKMHALENKKQQLRSKAAAENRQIFSSEQHHIHNYEEQISALKKQETELSSFRDKSVSSFSIEHSPIANHSIGLGLLHLHNYQQWTHKNHTQDSSSAISVFYKYQLWKNDFFAFSFMPAISFGKYDKDQRYKNYDLNFAFGGLQTQSENSSIYAEAAATLRRYDHPYISKDIGYIFSLQHGINWHAYDISLYNFSSWEIAKANNSVYKNIAYTQISVAKSTTLSNIERLKFNLQIGYFYKYSMLKKKYAISGPIIGLSLNV